MAIQDREAVEFEELLANVSPRASRKGLDLTDGCQSPCWDAVESAVLVSIEYRWLRIDPELRLGGGTAPQNSHQVVQGGSRLVQHIAQGKRDRVRWVAYYFRPKHADPSFSVDRRRRSHGTGGPFVG
jgi:hypothetical protein